MAVRGPGFRFSVPTGWKVTHREVEVDATARRVPRTLVSVRVFRLRKPYAPAEFATAARELDSVAAKLAALAHSRLSESVTTTVDGRRIRAYRYRARPAGRPAYDGRIGFLLDGRREYELFCQNDAGKGDVDGGCALLFSSLHVD